MRIRRIIREEVINFANHKLMLNELSRKGIGLTDYIRQKYYIMGNSFTLRTGQGEEWYTKNDIRNELMRRFNISKDFAEEIMDYYSEHNFS
tara:strand:- start:3207 stop:3479 length:273 start_codon:yes stop_codon:yes gene_type:complete